MTRRLLPGFTTHRVTHEHASCSLAPSFVSHPCPSPRLQGHIIQSNRAWWPIQLLNRVSQQQQQQQQLQ
jgi:hypothetical protein